MRRAVARGHQKFERQRGYLFVTLILQGVLTLLMADDPEFKYAGLAVAGIAFAGVITKRPAWTRKGRRWFGYAVPLLFLAPFTFFGVDELMFTIRLDMALEPKDFAWLAPVLAALVSMADWKATLSVPPFECPKCNTVIRNG